MAPKLDYPTIDKACNGTFLQYKEKWHRLIAIEGRCYNHGQDSKPGRGELVLENGDNINDQLIITKTTYSLDWINTLPYDTFGATWVGG